MRYRSKVRGGQWVRWAVAGLGSAFASAASGHPGGTPVDLTRVGIYCAHCHSSTAESDLEGMPEKARAELAENKHLASIRAGLGVYGQLSEGERAGLVELLSKVDRNSTITLEAPAEVVPGATFEVKVDLTGGAGPGVAVGLFDRPHRLFARPVTAAGFEVVGWPEVVGGEARRPEAPGGETTESEKSTAKVANLVDIGGVSSSADADRWARVRVVFTLKAPTKAGEYPLVGAYLYGTEKAVEISRRDDDPRFAPVPLGGEGGASGRVKFSSTHVVRVKAAP